VSTLVNWVTRHALVAPDFQTVSNSLGAIVVVLLLVLLVGREVVRTAGGPRAVRRLRALSIFTVPLFLSFVVVEAARFAYVIF
jgi:hypothetical protein